MGAGHGTAGIGFKYGKMKGLKISPPQSVARIDHTSFLCERSFRILLLPTYPPSALSYQPLPPPPPPLLRVRLSSPPRLPRFLQPPLFSGASPSPPPTAELLSPVVHLPFRGSRPVRNMPFFKQPIRRARWYVRAFSSVCRPPQRNVAFTRFP